MAGMNSAGYASRTSTPATSSTWGSTTVDRDEMLAFARRFDPQPFHVDERGRDESLLGGLCASGWFTCSLWMRAYVDTVLAGSTSQGSPGGKRDLLARTGLPGRRTHLPGGDRADPEVGEPSRARPGGDDGDRVARRDVGAAERLHRHLRGQDRRSGALFRHSPSIAIRRRTCPEPGLRLEPLIRPIRARNPSRLTAMGSYARPPFPVGQYLDEDGRPIPYGRRWNGSPPGDSYSRTSHTERYRGLHDVATAVISYLTRTYDVYPV